MGVTRKEAIRLMGGAAAGAAIGLGIGGPAAASSGGGPVIRRDVCVLGGGSAGTYTAVRLRDLGASVAVVERQDRLGGHTETFHDPVTGGTIDIGVVVSARPAAGPRLLRPVRHPAGAGGRVPGRHAVPRPAYRAPGRGLRTAAAGEPAHLHRPAPAAPVPPERVRPARPGAGRPADAVRRVRHEVRPRAARAAGLAVRPGPGRPAADCRALRRSQLRPRRRAAASPPARSCRPRPATTACCTSGRPTTSATTSSRLARAAVERGRDGVRVRSATPARAAHYPLRQARGDVPAVAARVHRLRPRRPRALAVRPVPQRRYWTAWPGCTACPTGVDIANTGADTPYHLPVLPGIYGVGPDRRPGASTT